MLRIARTAALLVLTGLTSAYGTSLLQASLRGTAQATASAGLSAALPVEIILIMQDAKSVAESHARMGLR